MQEHEQAKLDLQQLIDTKGFILKHTLISTDDDGRKHYRIMVGNPNNIVLGGDFFCGWRVDEPTTIDVLMCFLLDQSTLDGLPEGSDWIDWAHQFGMLGTTEDTRKAQKAYESIQEKTEYLKAMLGADYERALELAQQL